MNTVENLVRWLIPLIVFVPLCALGVGDAARGEVGYQWVTINDTGNFPDDTGFGAVDHQYRIGRFEVSNSQYVEFLNAVAVVDTNDLYISKMTAWPGGGITRTGEAGSYHYSAKPDWENKPAAYVTWWSAMRFANWMHNGQPSGLQNAQTTENGAYALTQDRVDSMTVTRNAAAKVFLPSENEWYKAAYYKSDGVDAGYWDYPTSSDQPPAATDPPGGENAANYDSGIRFTDVGSYTLSSSPYGTFDQAGNIWEWTEEILNRSPKVVSMRGGAAPRDFERLMSEWRQTHSPDHGMVGFRLASRTLSLLPADFNSDGVLSVDDLNVMRLGNSKFDVTGDGTTDSNDLHRMVTDLIGTRFGDSNGDGLFTSADWVKVFIAGKYEVDDPARWTEGDWNLDGRFNSNDLVLAYTEGGYVDDTRSSVAAVPEPSSAVTLALLMSLTLYAVDLQRLRCSE